MKAFLERFTIVFLHGLLAYLLMSCSVSRIPDVSEVDEKVPINGSKSAGLLLYNDYQSTVYLIEETVPNWIEIQGLKNAELAPRQVAEVKVIARCGSKAEIRSTTVWLKSADQEVSKAINVRIQCFDPNPPSPADPISPVPLDPAPPNPLPSGDTSYLGNPNFSPSILDDVEEDENGITLRGWYDRLLEAAKAGYYDEYFDRARNRPANRTGAMHIASFLIGLRLLGDLKLLDESIRLTELWYKHLTPDRETNNYLHHDDPVDDKTLDVTLAAGVWARVMYAAYVNRNLKSPAGYDYGSIASKYKTYLTDHYFPRWVILSASVKSPLEWRASMFRHSHTGTIAAQYYIGKMGGGGGYTADQWLEAAKKNFDLFFSADAVCKAGRDGRETLVFPFNSFAETTNPNGAALMYTIYLRYTITFMMDLFLEGADPRLNDKWWSRFSHSLADLVINPDSESTRTIGRTIAGDSPTSLERCGVPYNHDYRAPVTTTQNRWQDGGFAYLEGWDSLGIVTNFGVSMYSQASASFRDSHANYPMARIFTHYYHGWK